MIDHLVAGRRDLQRETPSLSTRVAEVMAVHDAATVVRQLGITRPTVCARVIITGFACDADGQLPRLGAAQTS